MLGLTHGKQTLNWDANTKIKTIGALVSKGSCRINP